MIPQPEVISKKGQEITAYKTRSARRKRMRISVLKLENAFLRQLLQGKDENTLKTLRAGNADAADITTGVQTPAGRAENTDSVLKSPDMMPSGCIQRAGCCLLMLILSYISPRGGR